MISEVNECENIFHGFLYVFDLAFVILKGKIPQNFLEISSRDLTSSLLLFFFSQSNDLITQSLVPVPFLIARLNALQAAVNILTVYQSHVFAKLHKQNEI
jgi:hypothetical protein